MILLKFNFLLSIIVNLNIDKLVIIGEGFDEDFLRVPIMPLILITLSNYESFKAKSGASGTPLEL